MLRCFAWNVLSFDSNHIIRFIQGSAVQKGTAVTNHSVCETFTNRLQMLQLVIEVKTCVPLATESSRYVWSITLCALPPPLPPPPSPPPLLFLSFVLYGSLVHC